MSSKFVLGGLKVSLSLALACSQASIFLPAVLAADNQVNIAGNPVFEITGPSATTAGRVVKIQANIDNSLAACSDRDPSAVKITYVKGLPVISLGGYYISTVDNATAKAANTTPSLLAQKWANALRASMANKASIDAYVAQLTGKNAPVTASIPITADNSANSSPAAAIPEALASTSGAPSPMPAPTSDTSNTNSETSSGDSYPSVDTMPGTAPDFSHASNSNAPQAGGWQGMPSTGTATESAGPNAIPPGGNPAPSNGGASPGGVSPQLEHPPYQGSILYIPAGMMIPVRLATSISSQVARAGDVIMAKTYEAIILANGTIPAESTLIGQVTEAGAGSRMAHSGSLEIKFTTLRLPNGVDTPISAHITGKIGKYEEKGDSSIRGENGMSKVKNSLVATAIGAGTGSALGVAVGAIASGERGLGRGAWSGAAIGGGLGLAESLLIRKGSDVNLKQGDTVNLQLDAPVTTAMN